MNDEFVGGAVGAAFGLAAALATLTLPRGLRLPVVYSQLVMMVGIYVGFATSGLGQLQPLDFGALGDIGIHSVAALIYSIAGALALVGDRPRFLGVLILTHGSVDLLTRYVSPVAPDWYGVLCAAFDLSAGATYIALSGRLAKMQLADGGAN